MIRKEKVLSIIAQNEDTALMKREGNNLELKDLEWPEGRKRLIEQIANLPEDELLDLVALMDYGRECKSWDKANCCDPALFSEKRMIADSSFKGKNKKTTALYLLQKGSFLSDYLRYSLGIYPAEGFVF